MSSSWSEKKYLEVHPTKTYAPCIYSFSCLSCIDYFGRRAAFIEGFSGRHMFACCSRRGWVCISSLIYKPRFLGRDILSFLRPWWTCWFRFLLDFFFSLLLRKFGRFRQPDTAFLGHVERIFSRISGQTRADAGFKPKTEMTSPSSYKENTKWKCKRVADVRDSWRHLVGFKGNTYSRIHKKNDFRMRYFRKYILEEIISVWQKMVKKSERK